MTGKREGPPLGSRKVPGVKAWTTEDGMIYGADFKPLSNRSKRREKSHYTTATMDEPKGKKKRRTMSIAQMMAQTWLPPQPPNTKLVHLDGDTMNNAASNLAWKPIDTDKQMRERYYAKALLEMKDPNDRRHGTKAGYTIGCRCQRCLNATRVQKAATATRKMLRALGIDPNETTHRS